MESEIWQRVVLVSKYLFCSAATGPSFWPDNRFPKLLSPPPPFNDAGKSM
jgi:hypothetical protein